MYLVEYIPLNLIRINHVIRTLREKVVWLSPTIYG